MENSNDAGPELRSEKGKHELSYWRTRKEEETTLSNRHYQYFYTSHFGFDTAFYDGKKILDIGCGPRGSLEWADMVCERIGLDPLAELYSELGTDSHKMTYVGTGAEKIPFPENYFDVVCSFNSLDHVDDLDETVKEIVRVIAPGGVFLLLTDVNHKATLCEPIEYSWDIVEKFLPNLKLLEERRYEKLAGGMYASIQQGVPYDHDDKARRYGVLSAKFIKIASSDLVEHIGYRDLLKQIRYATNTALPPNAKVLVISKGDDELLELNGRQAGHFPQGEDGGYAGYHPADSAEAIAHLKELQANGSEYLVFPNTAFWWLDYYTEFHQYLNAHHRRVWENEHCIIYQLTEPEAIERRDP